MIEAEVKDLGRGRGGGADHFSAPRRQDGIDLMRNPLETTYRRQRSSPDPFHSTASRRKAATKLACECL